MQCTWMKFLAVFKEHVCVGVNLGHRCLESEDYALSCRPSQSEFYEI